MTVRLFGVGDVFPNVDDGRASFRHLSPILERADLVVGNCEGVYSDDAAPVPSHKHRMIVPRARAEGLGAAPFHLLSCANNHAMDGGYRGLLDTFDVLSSQGIAVVGAGKDLEAASTPTFLERGGKRFGFVGLASVFPVGYEARPARPGLLALRVRTFYSEPDRNFWEPGIAPRISTEPFAEDLEACATALARARADADVVVALCHWGYSSWLEVLQEYELDLARFMVDAGADIVLCCHHHSLRGVEFYNERPIFYGLGSLVHHIRIPPVSARDRARRIAKQGPKAHVSSADFPLFPFHPDARMTGIASFEVAADNSLAVGFVPAMVLDDGSTEPLSFDDTRAGAVADYLERLSKESGFETKFVRKNWDGAMFLDVEPG